MPSAIDMFFASLVGISTALVLVKGLFWVFRANWRAYRLFQHDKAQAEANAQRVPEQRLLSAARRGGWIGAKLAQRQFRHKTRKEPFRSQLNAIGMTQALIASAMIVIGGAATWVPHPKFLAQIVPIEGFGAVAPQAEIVSALAPEVSIRPKVRR